LQSSISSTADKWEKGDTVLKNHGEAIKSYYFLFYKKLI
jgi:hypothetical protein